MYPLKHLAAKACEKRDLEKWFSDVQCTLVASVQPICVVNLLYQRLCTGLRNPYSVLVLKLSSALATVLSLG